MILYLTINYKSKEIEDICTKRPKAIKHFDEKVFKKLSSIINYIEQATSLLDIINYPAYNFHDLEGKKRLNEWSIYIGNTGYRLILIPQDENNNFIEKGDVIKNCKTIKIIMITEVCNHYGE